MYCLFHFSYSQISHFCNILVFAQTPYFSHYDWYVSLFKLNVFSNKLSFVCLSFQVTSFKTGCRCFHSRIYFSAIAVLSPSKRSDIHLICFFIFLLYIKPPVSYQKTVQYWLFSWLGRSSPWFLLVGKSSWLENVHLAKARFWKT